MELPPDAPTVRLCQLTKWSDFNGYGFNLHTDKTKNIQTLGDIDKGSPAEAAGLMKGDRIVEVNGQNVFNENHRQVVERIKAVPNETRLLVVDPVSDQWYRERNIVIKGTLPSVKMLSSSRDVSNQDNTASQNNNNSSKRNNNKMANGDSMAEPTARLCHLRKWRDFDGYGFNLHADKAKGTQFIGIIDPHSPAETAGIRQNDKIIEVNGENVEKLPHREIVERIKTVPNETTLLVVDEAANKYFRDKGIQISSSMKNLQRLETPSVNPRNNNSSDKMPTLPSTPPPAQENKADSASSKNNPPMMSDTGALSDNPSLVPRKCHLRKWADYEGYGFNLHADKANNLHFIGEVDEGSPAKLGGLRPGDRLVEVNGVNIDDITHKDIIERIKSNPQETELLVVCKETDQLYRDKGIVAKGTMKEVRVISTPAREVDHMDNTSSKSSSPKMLPSTPSSNRSEEIPPPTPSTTVDEYDVNGINSPSPAMNVEPPAYSEARNGRGSADSPMMDEKELSAEVSNMTVHGRENGKMNNSTNSDESGGAASPIFSMKASDVREMLRQRKKKDPRVQNMDLMQKFKIMEQL
ncbi:Na(+)/H(+) exchange regulatory cofactor NHE-RF1 [Galendromus occidentalis]|uniref:Na(+)/H(+) exchange regulatory cofactor NHE-RF1 n=1 Tax=Galendromus occidentalis TaxID=34638 RepID=A0AAJ6VXE4_9ACAR|nr:Na(+)/H(+) exchange regulatory cofactor NHE-RF1 [Galendromus occidentalis]